MRRRRPMRGRRSPKPDAGGGTKSPARWRRVRFWSVLRVPGGSPYWMVMCEGVFQSCPVWVHAPAHCGANSVSRPDAGGAGARAGVPVPRADSPALSGAAHALGFMLRACALRMPCSGSTSGRGLPDAESRPVPAANGGAGSRASAGRASEDGKAASGGVHAFSASFMARSHREACCPRSGSGMPPAEASHAVPAACGAGGSSRGVSVPWVTMAISCSRRS